MRTPPYTQTDRTPWWRGLSYLVIVYLILGFTWWAVLLHIKNRDAFQAKTELLRIGMVAEGIYQNDEWFAQSSAFRALEDKYRHQQWMIYGESGVFVLSLIVGVILINRGYQKEVQAARQRRNFLLSITHELKSPLASIKLVLETLIKRPLPSEKVQDISQRALRETDRLHRLVNDLLFSAKLETAYQLFPEPVDLPRLLREVIHSFLESYPGAQVKFSSPENIILQGDKEGLTSIALNLLENAAKYSEGKPFIDIRLQVQGDKIVWTTADRGIGIEEKEKFRIFDKFYRVGNEDTRKTKGTGLGLYIVDQIVKAHGGRITVSDNLPKGTVFVIEIPN